MTSFEKTVVIDGKGHLLGKYHLLCQCTNSQVVLPRLLQNRFSTVNTSLWSVARTSISLENFSEINSSSMHTFANVVDTILLEYGVPIPVHTVTACWPGFRAHSISVRHREFSIKLSVAWFHARRNGVRLLWNDWRCSRVSHHHMTNKREWLCRKHWECWGWNQAGNTAL